MKIPPKQFSREALEKVKAKRRAKALGLKKPKGKKFRKPDIKPPKPYRPFSG